MADLNLETGLVSVSQLSARSREIKPRQETYTASLEGAHYTLSILSIPPGWHASVKA